MRYQGFLHVMLCLKSILVCGLTHGSILSTLDHRFCGPNCLGNGPNTTNICIMLIKRNNNPKKDRRNWNYSFAYFKNMYNVFTLFTGPKKVARIYILPVVKKRLRY